MMIDSWRNEVASTRHFHRDCSTDVLVGHRGSPVVHGVGLDYDCIECWHFPGDAGRLSWLYCEALVWDVDDWT